MDVNKVDVFTIDRKLAAFEVDKNKELDDYYDSGESSTCFQKLGNHLGSIFRVTSSLTLEEAEAEYEARKERREDELVEIVEKKVYKTPWVFSVYGLFGSILGLAVVSIGFVLWKRENVYTNQDAWYIFTFYSSSQKLFITASRWSCILRCGTVWVSSLTGSMLINSAAWYNFQMNMMNTNLFYKLIINERNIRLGLPCLLVPSTYFAVTLAGSMGMMGMW